MHDDIKQADFPTKPQFENANCKFYRRQSSKVAKMKRTREIKQHEGA